MMFLHSRLIGVFAFALAASAAPTTCPPAEEPAQDQCIGVACPENTYCKVFNFRLEHPVACKSNGTVPADAQTCGEVICPIGKTCCNSPCGVCANPGESCLEWVC
ncbi:hypothetical protein CORC01_04670 [Colletotrichum orchidophilum]|uniref:Uncharacterized protein n=1 Tax=Colletotrichum orchidophilum TaxID=1209926 RepID=A0A1G4BF80_9PEZI|nr:uncharacterized protein CORC01_04670 [Colletotrichum orchidophilum]OHF00024.1 hypothetical protein CORC01_04670 [Colletotrichum orchidophilum]